MEARITRGTRCRNVALEGGERRGGEKRIGSSVSFVRRDEKSAVVIIGPVVIAERDYLRECGRGKKEKCVRI